MIKLDQLWILTIVHLFHSFLPIFPRILPHCFIMLSDETFPIDFEDDHYTHDTNLNTLASAETSASTSAYSSENTCNISSAKSLGNASSDQNDSHYASFDACASIGKVTLPAPRAPVKKKKSYSCHDLMGSKKNYDHVESKVMKMFFVVTSLLEFRHQTNIKSYH